MWFSKSSFIIIIIIGIGFVSNLLLNREHVKPYETKKYNTSIYQADLFAQDLCIVEDKTKGKRYIETFFHEPTNKYLSGQTIVPIKKFILLDQNNYVMAISDSKLKNGIKMEKNLLHIWIRMQQKKNLMY